MSDPRCTTISQSYEDLLAENENLRESIAHSNQYISEALKLTVSVLRGNMSSIHEGRAREILAQTDLQITAVAHLHRDLSRNAPHQTVTLDEYLRDLLRIMADGAGLHCEFDADPVLLDARKSLHVALILNELMTTVARQGSPESADLDRVVRIGLSQQPGSVLAITLDNDASAASTVRIADGSEGMGMVLMRELLVHLDARMTTRAGAGGGAHYKITIPL